MSAALLIVPGVVAAAIGGELFIRGAVGGANRLRIAPGIVGATVAAFATSSPEMSVGINAATAGRPEIALGDALGSNVVNVGLVLGIAVLLGGLKTRRADVVRDVPVALLAPLLVVLLAWDGVISRTDGVVLITAFTAWLLITIRQAARERSDTVAVLADRTTGRIIRDSIIGLVLLILAGRLIVLAAGDIGVLLGWDAFTVGALLVAVATSVPELATVVVARLRGHDEISLGTVLGSNIFNGLLIIGVAAAIHPIGILGAEFAAAIVASIVTLLIVIPPRSGRLHPVRGGLLLAVYAAYVIVLLSTHQPT